ncbi:MAG: hypothetical protein AB8V23_04105 [Candidatus Midichloria sp.]
MNGDGIDDVERSARAVQIQAIRLMLMQGRYSIFGKASFADTLELSALNGTNGFTLNGIAAGDRASTSIAAVGGVNSDRKNDIIITSGVSLFFHKTEGLLSLKT